MTTEPNPSIFTKIINGEIPGYIPYQNDTIAVLVALEGHLLVVPKVQYETIYELPEAVGLEMMRVAMHLAPILKDITRCDGMNLIQSNGKAAGQEVFHVHLHLKPRYVGDDTVLDWNTTMKSADEREQLSNAIKASL
jgi:histidine triad (HIT) family protein